MPRLSSYLLVFALAALPATAHAEHRAPVPAQVSVCFVPAESCRNDIVSAIAGAKKEVRIQAFRFDVPDIANALVAAKKRGVDVAIIFTGGIEKRARKAACTADDPDFAVTESVVEAGIPVYVDRDVKIAHNKVTIVDGDLVLGGSYNYGANVERTNADNLISIQSKEVASWYLANWNSRKAVSRPLGALECRDRP